jgi:protease-4
MSDASPPPAPDPRRRRRGLLGCAFLLSLLFNAVAVVLFVLGCVGLWYREEISEGGEQAPTEIPYAGPTSAADKVAIIGLDGVIYEGVLGFVHKEIDQAARDKHVKAVVLRVNSPGGSVTASDDLYQRLADLVHGNTLKGTAGKTLVASFGSLAASGGYYAALPAQLILAERSSLTGSIGVFAAFPNFKRLADQYGVEVRFIKQGDIKDNGSPFKDMTPKERQVWQDMVDHAYRQFVQVVEEGRPALRGGALLARHEITPVRAGPAWLPQPKPEAPAREPQPGPYPRYLADGGIWTADKALEFHLIDKIGRLDDAIREAHDLAGMGHSYRVIRYARPRPLARILLGIRAPEVSGELNLLSPHLLDAALTPRLWYLAPGHWPIVLDDKVTR